MRTLFKNKLLVIFVSLMMAVLCSAFGMLNLPSVKKAMAEGTETNNEITLSASEFYMEDGAAVRIAEKGGSGIRFGFSIAKTGWQKIQAEYSADTYTYKVYTEIDKTGNTDLNEEQVIVQDAFVFGENETEKLFWATIIYDDLSAQVEDLAFAISLTANTYIDIVKTSDNSVVKTFEASNNGQSRSMREVAWKAMEKDGLTGTVIENYRGTVADAATSQNFDAWGERFSAKVDGEVYGVYLNDYTTKVDSYTVEDGTLSFDWVNVEKSFKDQTVIVMTATGISTYPCTPVYMMNQNNAHRLRELSMEQVENRTCDVYVTEPIDMSQVTWERSFATTAIISYSINLDGQNNVISGLGTTSYSNNATLGSGLFDTFEGTIKNISFIGCAPTNAAGGLIADTIRNCTFENVYMEVDSFKSGNWFGAFSRDADNGMTVTMKNVYVSMPQHTASATFVTAFTNATYNMDNCVFVGGNGKAIYDRDGYTYTLNGTPVFCEDIKDAYGTYYGKTDIVATSFMANDAVSQVIPIANNNDDITKLLSATEGYFVLVEDISLAGRTDVLVNFSGTLNGNGHTIKNMPVRKNAGSSIFAGLWADFTGTIKNVALEITQMSSNYGGIAYSIFSGAVIDNVYISVAAYSSSVSTNYNAAVSRQGYLAGVTMTNVVIDMAETEVTNVAFVWGWYASGNHNFSGKNCYFIGGNGNVISYWEGKQTDKAQQITNANIYENRTAFNDAYSAEGSVITLTEEMKAWLGLN